MAEIMSSDGAVIAYERIGTGPLLLLVASMPPEVTGALVRSLLGRYSVLIYAPGGRDDAGIVADLLALIAAEGGAFVFAAGAAAVPALEAAAAMPRKIQALALYQPGGAALLPAAAPPLHWQNAIMPVLVIDGDEAPEGGAAQADRMAAGLHNAERITLAGQGADFDPSIMAPLLSVFFDMGSVQIH